jgi:uncharacterized protein (DUF885 family)
MTQSTGRSATMVDRIMDRYLDDYLALDPVAATYLGVPGRDDEVPDLSPDGLAEVSALRRRTLAELDAATSADESDRITIAAASEQLRTEEEIRATGAEEARLNNIESPVQILRQVFDLMPTATAEDWAVIARRLTRLPDAMDSYITSLTTAAARGDIVPRRQVDAGIAQSRGSAAPNGFFATFAAGAAPADGELPNAIRQDLDRGAADAARAYDHLATFLADELLSRAPTEDAVGRDRYALASRHFLGAQVDLEETYEWGQAELARIEEEMRSVADRISSGSTPREAMTHLSSDPARKLQGTDALRHWMQDKSDAAIRALADTHFDIPEPIRVLECRIAPTSTGGIYYTGPSEDFSRPGRMWWAVPDGVAEFSTWRELTTVYHEGVPGHHLQVAQTVYRRELLNRWRRLASWTSGHGEGWALYAERLMADLGYLDDPGDYLGMLDGQSMRAARVVIDIGVHCGFQAPAEVGGGPWTYESAWQFLLAHASMAPEFLRFELDRYLGWPGQAPSYKIGERLWLQLRDDARAKAGDDFDLKTFHRRALDIGSVGLDVLRGAVLGEYAD